MIYVDPLRQCIKSTRWPYSESCHLFADDEKELIFFAIRLGLRKRWFQKDKRLPHFDLTRNMRYRAVRCGAKEVDIVFVSEFMKRRRDEAKKAARQEDQQH